MTELDIDDILLKVCSLRRNDEVNKLSLSETDCIAVAQRASNQGVAAWTLRQLNTLYDDTPTLSTIKASLKQLSFVALADCQHKCLTYFKIAKILADEGIKVVALKGVAMMMGYYPEISYRTIGDIDILVNHDDVYRAYDILLQNFPQKLKNTSRTHILTESVRTHLPGLMIDGILVELHYNLYSADSVRCPQCDLFQHVRELSLGKQAFYAFDETLMLYHLSTHAVKSRADKGIRLNWIVDILVLFEKTPEQIVDVCRNALKINQKMNSEMQSFWQRIFSMLPKEVSESVCKNLNLKELQLDAAYIQNTHEGITKGNFRTMRTLASVVRGMRRELKHKKGVSAKWQHIKDMIHDLHHRRT